ncbi:hypothetical protein [Winogradskyella pulchriflava]|uniref:Uncharacterized protein n=1 Tax=Winogradskyella pulchriflava TaxID=1110688 RepID=A0ABV6QC64_9FLAO
MRQPGYPVVLDTLVNRLITDWEIFKAHQPQLHDILDNPNPKLLADTVRESYIRRKQAFAELEHYHRTKKLLGKHPIFELIHLKDAISALDTVRLTKKITALKANLTRNRQKNNTDLVTRDEALLKHAESVLEKR